MTKRHTSLLFAGLSAATGAALVAGGCSLSAPRWRGHVTDHFDGKRFRSVEPLNHGFSDFLGWITHRERGTWRDFTDTPPGPRPPRRVDAGALRVTFVNHSTVLLQMDGLNLLTDPVWSPRVSPVSFAGPRRHRPPGLRFQDLPPIDAVLVSHNHYDHMDLPTLRRLSRAHAPAVFVGLGNAAYLERRGVTRAQDLDWWKSASLAPGVTLTAVPARHFSSRGLRPRPNALVRLGRARSLRRDLLRRRHRLGLAFRSHRPALPRPPPCALADRRLPSPLVHGGSAHRPGGCGPCARGPWSGHVDRDPLRDLRSGRRRRVRARRGAGGRGRPARSETSLRRSRQRRVARRFAGAGDAAMKVPPLQSYRGRFPASSSARSFFGATAR